MMDAMQFLPSHPPLKGRVGCSPIPSPPQGERVRVRGRSLDLQTRRVRPSLRERVGFSFNGAAYG